MAVLATLRRSGDKKEEREQTKELTSDIYKEMYKFIWESETTWEHADSGPIFFLKRPFCFPKLSQIIVFSDLFNC